MKRFYARGQWCWVALLVLGTTTAVVPRATAGANYSATILADNPIGYWRLGEPQTTSTALDSSASARNGIYTRGVVSGVTGAIVGDPDTAATFDGLSSFVDIPNTGGNDPFTLMNSFTLEAWVVNAGQGIVDSARSPLGRIVSNGWPGNIGYGFGILDPGRGEGLRFTTYGVKDYDSSVAIIPQDGMWHYVAVVFDSSNTANFYVDGQPMGSIPASSPARPAALDFQIGRNPGSSAEEFFNGNIDEVAIYNVELTADQILAHYNAGK